jgi:alkylhydroperoxidase family enzyme
MQTPTDLHRAVERFRVLYFRSGNSLLRNSSSNRNTLVLQRHLRSIRTRRVTSADFIANHHNMRERRKHRSSRQVLPDWIC